MIAYHSREIGNILLYYYHLKDISGERKIETEQGYGLGIGGYKRLCRRGRGAWLGYTVFPVCVG